MRRYSFVILIALLGIAFGLSAQDNALTVTESDPLPGEEIGLADTITVFFDRELACESSSANISPAADVDFACVEGNTAVMLTPQGEYQPATTYTLTLQAQGADGATLAEPFTLEFNTPGFLEVTEVLPAPGTSDIATDAVITVIFNRPVVPLVTVEDMDDLPQPLSISPAVAGSGEWLNTSIYTFEPEIAWTPGTEYTLTVEAGLEAVDGAALQEPFSWSFITAPPLYVEITPTNTTDGVRLDPMIQVVFNVPVLQASAEDNFYLRPVENLESLTGTFEWSEDGTGFAFRPNNLLQLDTLYEFGFPADTVQDITGGVTFDALTSIFTTVPAPAIVGTDPFDGQQDVQPFNGITLFFASPMADEGFTDNIVIEPEPFREPRYFYQEFDNSLRISFSLEPSADYSVTVQPGLEDIYGNTIEQPLSFSFSTAPYGPNVNLEAPFPIGFYNGQREETQVFVTHRNVSQLDLNLYTVPTGEFIRLSASEDSFRQLEEYQPPADALLRNWQIASVAPQNALRYELLDLADAEGDATASAECPGSLPTRLSVGDSAIVVTEPDPLRARSEPPGGEIVELLYRDYVMPVVDGPRCIDGIRWWQVELRDGSAVWVAESVDEEYLIDLRTPGTTTGIQVPGDLGEFTEGDALRPGVYMLQISAPEISGEGQRPLRHYLVVGSANLTVKYGLDSMVVWATDVQTGQPIPDAPVTIYDEGFNALAGGTTDSDGVLRLDTQMVDNLYQHRMAVLDSDAYFGLGLTNWSEGIDPWQFGQPTNYYPSEYTIYLYTDRPIYRPDQPVYFRGIVRSKNDVSYTPPEVDSVTVRIYDNQNEIVYEAPQTELNEFGTFDAQFDIAADAGLGFYRLEVELNDVPGQIVNRNRGFLSFSVAEFRLPEFEVNLQAESEEVVQGETIQLLLESRYFFGGLVANADVEYNVVARPYNFRYEGPGSYDFTDFNPDGGPGEFFGSSSGMVASGTGTTDEDGTLLFEVPAELEDATQSQQFTIEALVRDESDQTVAGRTEVIVHQGEIYIGARPEEYVSTANQETTLNFIAVDWESNPVDDQPINVEIVERRWSNVQEEDAQGRTNWTWEVEEIPVDSGEVTTGNDGTVDYNFTPPNGGIFSATITTRDDAGNEVRASTTFWVSSRDYVTWRQQNSNRIDLVSDANDYTIGDTAEILITSPFQGTVEALVTVERGETMLAEQITMESNSYVYELPITAEYAPNAFVSVMIVKGVDENNPVAGFRFGMIQLNIDPERKELQIDIQPDQEQAGPRETVTYTITTTDYAGTPVPAEVGVGLTDVASLSIADPNSRPIMDVFYGQQGVAVRTSTPLTINTDQITQTVLDTIKGGGGGFGEGGIFDIRQEFVDTAYWNGSLVTGDDGTATFEVTLPDNLTRWRLDARALTLAEDGNMLVGQETFDLLSTKPLLIRPVTPRFFVVGDELIVAAIVNNNTDEALTVEVALEGTGLSFNGDAVQTVVVPAGGGTRVDWPVSVQNAENADLTFFARTEDNALTDASKPPLGQGENQLLPVYRYEAPEVVGTGGLLRESGSVTESIALPTRFDVTQGELTINMERSLAATALEGLDYLENFRTVGIEGTISSFLPNIMTFRALQDLGVEDPQLEAALNTRVQIAIQRLNAQQKVDGGWGWFVQDDSDPLITAYALIGLTEAQASGFPVDPGLIERAQGYLRAQYQAPANLNFDWQVDRQVFILYAMARSGAPDAGRMSTFYDERSRLSIYAKSLLAVGLDAAGENTERINTLLSEINNAAIVSANGTHWEEEQRDFRNWNTDTRTTAITLGALVQLRPDSDLIPNVVRWLMVARDADAWETTQETAWALMALTDWMVVTNELAADYEYNVQFNDDTLTGATVSPDNVTESETLIIEVGEMLQETANRLVISRTEGTGNLYYTAYLEALLPVPEIEPLNRGIIIERRYTLLDDPDNATITEAQIGEVVQVRLTIIAPNDLHYVVIEDPIPAGTEGINPGLATEQQIGTRPGLDSDDPVSRGWGWWWFSNIEFRDEKVVLNSTYLPAGTYEYVYTIRPGLEGTYNVIPPTGREFFFPDVFGRGAGSEFTVLPAD